MQLFALTSSRDEITEPDPTGIRTTSKMPDLAVAAPPAKTTTPTKRPFVEEDAVGADNGRVNARRRRSSSPRSAAGSREEEEEEAEVERTAAGEREESNARTIEVRG